MEVDSYDVDCNDDEDDDDDDRRGAHASNLKIKTLSSTNVQ